MLQRIKQNLSTATVTALTAVAISSYGAGASTTTDMGPMQVIRLNPWSMRRQDVSAETRASVAESGGASTPPGKILKGQAKVSEPFHQEIQRALAKIPANIITALEKSGYKISLNKTVTEAVPAARNKQVRGYEKHATWESVYGMFNRASKEIVMAEFAAGAGGDNQQLVTLNSEFRRQGILRHEIGHAVDQYLGNYSHSSEFKRRYELGVTAINQDERKVLFYYLQPGNAGREETFAELFACMDETGCDRDSDRLLRQHFGDLMNLIRTRVASLK